MTTTTKKFPLISFLVCICGVIVLCGLGIWQLERLQWKNNLQQQLDAAFAQPGTNPLDDLQISELQQGQIIRGRVDGSIDFSKAILLNGRIQDGQSAKAVVVPLTTINDMSLAAEIGCAINPDISDIRAMGPKSVIVMGAVRVPRWSFAAPSNDATKDQWWRLDPTEIGPHWGMNNLKKSVMSIENSKDFIETLLPCPVEKNLRNDHLSYAVFWFSMAFVLIVMWGLRFLRPYLQSA